MFSDLSGDNKCDVVFNPSGGLINDVRRYIISSRTMIPTPVVEKLHKKWNHFFDNSPKDSQYLQLAHSEGVNNTRIALLSYNNTRASRISVVAIAPSVYIDSGTCKSIDHYRSTHDPIPWFDSRGRTINQETTHVLDRDPNESWFDHDCSSRTYQKPLKDIVTDHFNT